MLFKSCLDLLCKQILLPRPLLVVGSQSAPWYSTSSLYPPPPKRNKSAWVFYFVEHFPLLKKENPQSSKAEIFSKLSENWRKMDKSILEKYHQLALQDKQKYTDEIESYRATLSPEAKLALAQQKQNKRKKPDEKKQLKALGMPKRPPNAYILFSVDYVKKNFASPKDAFKESSRISEAWANLPAAEKSKWSELAVAKDKEYRKKLEEWETEMTSKGHLEVIHTKSKQK